MFNILLILGVIISSIIGFTLGVILEKTLWDDEKNESDSMIKKIEF